VAFEACLILVRNVVGELRPKRTLAASRGFLAAARLSCELYRCKVGPFFETQCSFCAIIFIHKF